jgi:hypothetical protein
MAVPYSRAAAAARAYAMTLPRSLGTSIFAVLLPLEQLFHGVFVLVIEFLGVELTRLRLNDVGREVQHILCYLRLGNVFEILIFFPNLIGGNAT